MGRWRRPSRIGGRSRVDGGRAGEELPDSPARPAAAWPPALPAADEIGSVRQPTGSRPAWARLPSWVRLPGWAPRHGRTPLGAALAVVLLAATTTVLTVTPVGKRWACDQLELGCPAPFRVAVWADPGSAGDVAPDPSGGFGVSGTPGTASYLYGGDPGDLGPPPDGRDDCRGWTAWAASIGAASAGATPLRLDVAATAHDPVRVVGFTLRVDDDIRFPPPASTSAPGLALTCDATPAAGTPTAGKPAAQRRADVALSLDDRLINSQDPVVTLPVEQAEPIAPGTAASFALTTTSTTCDCRWRVEVELLAGRDRTVVTVGPDGARPGTAANNPDQPSFATTTGTWGRIPVRYLAGRWQLDRHTFSSAPGPSSATCLLASTPEVLAALDSAGVTASSATQFDAGGDESGHIRGTPTTLCSWRLPSDRTDLGAVLLEGNTLADEATARATFASMRVAFFDSAVDRCGFLSGRAPTAAAVRGVGDEATSVPGLLLARAANRIVIVSVCAPADADARPADAPAVPGDLAALSMLARAVLGATW